MNTKPKGSYHYCRYCGTIFFFPISIKIDKKCEICAAKGKTRKIFKIIGYVPTDAKEYIDLS